MCNKIRALSRALLYTNLWMLNAIRYDTYDCVVVCKSHEIQEYNNKCLDMIRVYAKDVAKMCFDDYEKRKIE